MPLRCLYGMKHEKVRKFVLTLYSVYERYICCVANFAKY